jgi:hypothetical protein
MVNWTGFKNRVLCLTLRFLWRRPLALFIRNSTHTAPINSSQTCVTEVGSTSSKDLFEFGSFVGTGFLAATPRLLSSDVYPSSRYYVHILSINLPSLTCHMGTVTDVYALCHVRYWHRFWWTVLVARTWALQRPSFYGLVSVYLLVVTC